MATKKKGYVPIWRDLQDHWLWQSNTPFDMRSAWIDLLLSVNHEERKIQIGNRVQTIKAGQKWTSYRTLAEKWHWSKDRVKRYIKLLKNDGMVYTDETRNGTLLTIVNYENFIIKRDTNKDTNKDTDKDTPKDTNKDADKDVTIIKENVNTIKNEEERRAAIWEAEGWQ